MSKTKSTMAKATFTVANDRGIHTRPATEIVKCAVNFKSTIKLRYKQNLVSAKSLLGILMLAAAKGAKIQVEARGEDATEAVSALVTLAEHNFNMAY